MKFALVLALSHNAELLIMDEPTSGLDPLVRSQFLEIVMDYMKNGGKGVFFSTHITSDLDKIADIDLVFPVAAIKVVPCVHVLFLLFVLSAVLFYGNKKRTASRITCDTAQTVGIEIHFTVHLITELPAPRWFALHLCPSVAGNLSGISITHLPLNMQLPKVTKNPCEKTVESV